MKILIIGEARHGKDTVAEMIRDEYGYTFKSSSMAALEIFLFEKLNNSYGRNYSSLEEAYEDRVNGSLRSVWFDEICEYNKDDPARLAKAILEKSDVYVGMRSLDELNACNEQEIFDLIIGVYDPRKPMEDISSNNIDSFLCSDLMIANNGTLEQLRGKVKRLSWLKKKEESKKEISTNSTQYTIPFLKKFESDVS